MTESGDGERTVKELEAEVTTLRKDLAFAEKEADYRKEEASRILMNKTESEAAADTLLVACVTQAQREKPQHSWVVKPVRYATMRKAYEQRFGVKLKNVPEKTARRCLGEIWEKGTDRERHTQALEEAAKREMADGRLGKGQAFPVVGDAGEKVGAVHEAPLAQEARLPAVDGDSGREGVAAKNKLGRVEWGYLPADKPYIVAGFNRGTLEARIMGVVQAGGSTCSPVTTEAIYSRVHGYWDSSQLALRRCQADVQKVLNHLVKKGYLKCVRLP